LTAKQDTGERVVEIETLISQRDFDDLFVQTVEKLEKNRYNLGIIRGGHLFIWEIDLFYSLEKCYPNPYFILAEHEMPEGQSTPDFIPDLIQQYLLYAVPIQESNEYSSKKLSSPAYAMERYRLLLSDKESPHVSSV